MCDAVQSARFLHRETLVPFLRNEQDICGSCGITWWAGREIPVAYLRAKRACGRHLTSYDIAGSRHFDLFPIEYFPDRHLRAERSRAGPSASLFKKRTVAAYLGNEQSTDHRQTLTESTSWGWTVLEFLLQPPRPGTGAQTPSNARGFVSAQFVPGQRGGLSEFARRRAFTKSNERDEVSGG